MLKFVKLINSIGFFNIVQNVFLLREKTIDLNKVIEISVALSKPWTKIKLNILKIIIYFSKIKKLLAMKLYT